ncbi:MAG: oligosaccharide flippase family protein [Methanolinea sp.]|jgi:O-antigen/teichoic acid export membrane protein|nr:oligosaccharide flippase family protein [Methanolinea sp.]
MDPRYIVRQMLGIDTVRRQALLSVGANVGITAVGYLATVYIAHAAGAEVLGAYFLFLAYYSLAALGADGGMGGAAVKLISEGKDEEAYFTAQAVIRLSLLALCTGLIVLVISPFMRDFSSAGLLPWLILALGAGAVGGILSTGVYGGGSAGALQVSEFASTVVRVVVQVASVYAGFAMAGMAGGFVAGILAAILINSRFLRFHVARFGWRHVRAMIPYAAWGFLTALAGVLAGYADTVLVGYFLDSTEVGYYRAPMQLAVLALFVATSLSTALFPWISRWKQEHEIESIRHTAGRALSYSLVLAVPLVTGGLILGERLLYFLYGSPFVVATTAFSLLLLAQIGMVIFTLDAMVLGALGQPRTVFFVNAASAALLIGLELVMIPLYGITGAATAVFLAYLARAAAARWSLSCHIHIGGERKVIGNILAAGAVMAAVVIILRSIIPLVHVAILVLVILAGALVFFMVLFRLDRVMHDELSQLGRHLGLPWPSWL